MGACATKPSTLEGEAPVELPVPAQETNAVEETTPVEATPATEAVVETSENKVEKEEAPLVDLSSPKAEEPKSEEPKTEEITTVGAEVVTAPKEEEAPLTETAAPVENKTEDKVDEVKPEEIKETPKA